VSLDRLESGGTNKVCFTPHSESADGILLGELRKVVVSLANSTHLLANTDYSQRVMYAATSNKLSSGVPHFPWRNSFDSGGGISAPYHAGMHVEK
jgi:hypothetical protein